MHLKISKNFIPMWCTQLIFQTLSSTPQPKYHTKAETVSFLLSNKNGWWTNNCVDYFDSAVLTVWSTVLWSQCNHNPVKRYIILHHYHYFDWWRGDSSIARWVYRHHTWWIRESLGASCYIWCSSSIQVGIQWTRRWKSMNASDDAVIKTATIGKIHHLEVYVRQLHLHGIHTDCDICLQRHSQQWCISSHDPFQEGGGFVENPVVALFLWRVWFNDLGFCLGLLLTCLLN